MARSPRGRGPRTKSTRGAQARHVANPAMAMRGQQKRRSLADAASAARSAHAVRRSPSRLVRVAPESRIEAATSCHDRRSSIQMTTRTAALATRKPSGTSAYVRVKRTTKLGASRMRKNSGTKMAGRTRGARMPAIAAMIADRIEPVLQMKRHVVRGAHEVKGGSMRRRVAQAGTADSAGTTRNSGSSRPKK